MGKCGKVFFYIVAMLVLIALMGGCNNSVQEVSSSTVQESSTPESAASQRTPQVVETGSGVTVISASDWASEHPDIYETYMRNRENDEHESYVENHPYIATLYEGMGFAFDYNSARGHALSVEDVVNTTRPHALANCFACKTPNFTAAVNNDGNGTYSIPFEEMLPQITESISCYNCHANEPGELIVTHTYLSDAMGDDLSSVDPANLSCGQCHVEYYFDPADKSVTLPYDGLDVMSPDDILAYYNGMEVDGKVFADYVNPRSGVRQIKVQHPEFETYLGEGSVHAKTYNCADCHMGTETSASGESFMSHYWTSPLDNPELVENSCSYCHNDFVGDMSKIQTEVKARTNAVSVALADLTEELVLAGESGDYTEDELDKIRSVYREAQFYWDFVFVENSYGAHNSKLTYENLDKAEALLNQVRVMLKLDEIVF